MKVETGGKVCKHDKRRLGRFSERTFWKTGGKMEGEMKERGWGGDQKFMPV